MIPAIANSLWLGASLREYRRFCQATKNIVQEQAAVLQSVVSSNAETEFGRRHGFCAIRSVSSYQQRVPLREYDELRDWITRMANGEKAVLTSEPVRSFQPTGGSTAGSKLVPYTAFLQQQFRRAIQPWVADLFIHHPQLLTGRAYWSISPVATKSDWTPGGIPVGFDDDTAYVGGWQQGLVESGLAVPGAISQIQDMDLVRYLTLFFLVRCRNLKLISVWNPTFLTLLMDYLQPWGDEIARDLERGILHRAPTAALLPPVRPERLRARELRRALRSSEAGERHALLWPELRIISCWTDGNAAAASACLQESFPQAQIQGKGLMATEGVVSFPLIGHSGAALAVRSHFFEFLPVQSSGELGAPCLAHQLVCGRQYAVVITTGGGLYRYQLGDLVEVTGHFNDCPLVRFIGRYDHVSDWFGEKLNEIHVSDVLHSTFQESHVAPAFAMLACDTRPVPAYVLYIETEAPDLILYSLARKIDDALSTNFQYRYARQLGQLAPLKIFRAQQAAASYLENAIAAGQRAGSVKSAALDRRDIWSSVFRGEFVVPA